MSRTTLRRNSSIYWIIFTRTSWLTDYSATSRIGHFRDVLFGAGKINRLWLPHWIFCLLLIIASCSCSCFFARLLWWANLAIRFIFFRHETFWDQIRVVLLGRWVWVEACTFASLWIKSLCTAFIVVSLLDTNIDVIELLGSFPISHLVLATWVDDALLSVDLISSEHTLSP